MALIYWRSGETRQNYGDYLNQYFFDTFGGVLKEPYDIERDSVLLIGSVIDGRWLQRAEDARNDPDGKVIFWSCGWRGQKHPPNMTERAIICAARGPFTRRRLKLPEDTPLGDPGLLLPVLYTPKAAAGAGRITACPHFSDKRGDATILEETGAEHIVKTSMRASFADVERHVDEIAQAEFAVCGAMHSAITAIAYGTPFCFYDGGGVDGPPKWKDLAASLGFEAHFCKTHAEGREWYDSIKAQIRIPNRVALLRACPLIVPDRFLERAAELDAADGA